MPDLPDPSPPPDAVDPTIRPRAVASRHFRKPAAEPATAGPVEDDARADNATAREDEELEQLTRQFKDLVGRKKDSGAKPPADEEARERRKPMPRSGNVNMAVMLGEPIDPATAVARAPEYVPNETYIEAPTVSLPAGFASMLWKLGSLAVAMFALGYFIAVKLDRSGSSAAGVAAVAPTPTPSFWRPRTIETLDRALAADQTGDLKAASQMVAELLAAEPGLPGLARYLAELQIRSGNFITAENSLLAMSNAGGRETLQALHLRALNAARQRHFDDVFRILQASLVLDPLRADSYYQLGEVLRRQGKFSDAVNMSRQALLRVRPGYGISASLIAFKLSLAQIEGGQGEEIAPALDIALKHPPVAPEWLFTAAALSLARNDRVGAAEWLEKARAVMPPDDFGVWVGDYFFQQQSGTRELAAFRVQDAERRRRQATSWEFFIDP